MKIFTDKFGFESDDLEAVTAEVSRATKLEAVPHHYEGRGGDYSAFGMLDSSDGKLSLYVNHFHDEIESVIQEKDFPEMGMILKVEQRDNYVDYEPVLRKIQTFKPILLCRRQYDSETRVTDVLFDLAKERSESS
jgi:hypothetical protein